MPKAKSGVRQNPDSPHPRGGPSQLEFPLSPRSDAPEDALADAPADALPGELAGGDLLGGDLKDWDAPGVEENAMPQHEAEDSPTFALVRESGIDGEKRCLYLVLESTQGERFRLDFTPGCIPLAATALLSELGFLQRHQPEVQAEVQPIVINACQLAETAEGSPALLAGMEGGGELPLQMSLQDLQKLNNRISEYIRSKALTRPFG